MKDLFYSFVAIIALLCLATVFVSLVLMIWVGVIFGVKVFGAAIIGFLGCVVVLKTGNRV